jgi:hypothetical protein
MRKSGRKLRTSRFFHDFQSRQNAYILYIFRINPFTLLQNFIRVEHRHSFSPAHITSMHADSRLKPSSSSPRTFLVFMSSLPVSALLKVGVSKHKNAAAAGWMNIFDGRINYLLNSSN